MASKGGKQLKRAARHKVSGKYIRQRDRTRANKIKYIEYALLTASAVKGYRPFSLPKDPKVPRPAIVPQATYLKERLAHWR